MEDLLQSPERLSSTRGGVEDLLEHARATGNKNLAVLCKVWLDPTDAHAKAYVERKIRDFIRRTAEARL